MRKLHFPAVVQFLYREFAVSNLNAKVSVFENDCDQVQEFTFDSRLVELTQKPVYPDWVEGLLEVNGDHSSFLIVSFDFSVA